MHQTLHRSRTDLEKTVPPHASRRDRAVPVTHAGPDEISRLHAALDLVTHQTNPRTALLLDAGLKRKAQKLFEEAGEVAIEATRRRPQAVVRESADLIYHLVVLWRECGVTPDDIWGEMRWRADLLGLAEKLPKALSDAGQGDPDHA